jgi:serine/threonine protein kinase
LLDEARTVGRMRHPSIVPIFEAGEEDGDLYLVFEYVPGKNLADFPAEWRLAAVKAVTTLRPFSMPSPMPTRRASSIAT